MTMKKNQRMQIGILEDNCERQAAMRECLEERFYQFRAVFFDDAQRMIGHLKSNLPATILICLDHDLELKQNGKGKLVDPGTGRDVANWLSMQAPSCPVVVHSTNSAAARGMEHLLEENGWKPTRVTPWGDLEWIDKEWKRAVRNALLQTAQPLKKGKNIRAASR